jgi:hypothetical protein
MGSKEDCGRAKFLDSWTATRSDEVVVVKKIASEYAILGLNRKGGKMDREQRKRAAIQFDLCLQQQPDRRYCGRQNLGLFVPERAAFLTDVQDAVNDALSEENKISPGHVAHQPFYFDYVDSVHPNALAFGDRDFSYIGVTMALVSTLWDSCVELDRSIGVRALLEIGSIPERKEAILTVMFQHQLIFLVLHEWTHHVHGHLPHLETGFFEEIMTSGNVGNLKSQAFEIDADGYAVYFALSHLMNGPRREQAINLLACEHAQPDMQDRVLFLSFVMAIGAMLLVLSPRSFDFSKCYTLTHPFPAVRMDWIMRRASNWCEQNDKATLVPMSQSTFQALMVVVEKASSQVSPANDWREQGEFMKSPFSSGYRRELMAFVRGQVQALRARSK